MKKLTKHTIVAIALALPVAAFAQAGTSTSGYPTGPGSSSATDARQAAAQGAVTTGTSASPTTSMVHPADVDPSGHTGSENGPASTSGTSTNPSTTPVPNGTSK